MLLRIRLVRLILNIEVDGIPRLYWYGTEDSMNVMVCELTGPNLSVLMRACNKAFTLKTTLMLGEQMVELIVKFL